MIFHLGEASFDFEACVPSATVGPVEAAWLSRFCVGEGGVDKMGVRHAVHELIGLHLAGTAALRHEAIARRALDFRKSGEIVLIDEPQQDRFPRSEEHTSELQSLMRISSAVFCLN